MSTKNEVWLTPEDRQWVDELRSRHHLQGTEELRPDTESFCCLGLRCDIAARSGRGRWSPDVGSGDRFVWAREGQTDLPPDGFAAAIGWQEPDPVVPAALVPESLLNHIQHMDGDVTLSLLNDERIDWRDLADIVEALAREGLLYRADFRQEFEAST